MQVLNTISCSELKQKYLEKVGDKEINLRFFFGGVEIQNDHKLFQHNIQDSYTIQILISKSESK